MSIVNSRVIVRELVNGNVFKDFRGDESNETVRP